MLRREREWRLLLLPRVEHSRGLHCVASKRYIELMSLEEGFRISISG